MPPEDVNDNHWDHFWQSGQTACCDAACGPEPAQAIDDALLDKVRETRIGVEHHRRRLMALTDAALDRGACEALGSLMGEDSNRPFRLDRLSSDDDRLVAWQLSISADQVKPLHFRR